MLPFTSLSLCLSLSLLNKAQGIFQTFFWISVFGNHICFLVTVSVWCWSFYIEWAIWIARFDTQMLCNKIFLKREKNKKQNSSLLTRCTTLHLLILVQAVVWPKWQMVFFFSEFLKKIKKCPMKMMKVTPASNRWTLAATRWLFKFERKKYLN